VVSSHETRPSLASPGVGITLFNVAGHQSPDHVGKVFRYSRVNSVQLPKRACKVRLLSEPLLGSIIRATIINLLDFSMEAIFVEKTGPGRSRKPAADDSGGLFFDTGY
jgi:hypothetical protein